MFAAITPALITGAFAERKRFGAFVLFTILWSILVYSPLAHWVWAADGWLFKLGALDFAGGTVVHISSGVSALVVALLIGRRVGNGERHRAARRADDRARRRPAVVRLVRLQRRVRAHGRRPRRQRVHRHQHRRRRRDDHLGPRRATCISARSASSAPPAARSPASSRSPRRPGFVTVGGALIIGLVAGGLCYSATLLRERAQGRRRARRLRRPRRRRHVRRRRDRRLRLDARSRPPTPACSTATRSSSSPSSSRSARRSPTRSSRPS